MILSIPPANTTSLEHTVFVPLFIVLGEQVSKLNVEGRIWSIDDVGTLMTVFSAKLVGLIILTLKPCGTV